MKVKMISRKLIKPSEPTPPHLRVYKISAMDELHKPLHVMRILYYRTSPGKDDAIALEEPLARVLTLFYLLAGRFNKEKRQVECNDEGVEYSVALIEDCTLDQLIRADDHVQPAHLNLLLPVEVCAADEPTDPMLAIQINRFKCGGLAIGICATRRIFDSASLGIFLNAWSDVASNSNLGVGPIIRPNFTSPSLFPSQNLPLNPPLTNNHTIVFKRFVFDKNAISTLRKRLTSTPEWESIRATNGGRPPSRVLVLSAFLSQALMRADAAKHGISRASLVMQPINVRERTIPPLPENSCGSWVYESYLDLGPGEDPSFAGMALKLRETVVRAVEDCATILSDGELGRNVMVDRHMAFAPKTKDPGYKFIRIADWSKFGDYDIDFGFGKPVWVSLAGTPVKDLFLLVGTKDNLGMEAWVYLDESDMPFFEQDEQLRMLIATPKIN